MSKYYEASWKYKVYSAGPFFNPEQLERSNYIKQALEELGFCVFDPKSANLVEPDSDKDWRQQAFENNIDAILESDFVLATTDGLDAGTMLECGVAYQADVPIVYFAETLGDKQFNLMLAQSGNHIILSREQLIKDLANPDIVDKIVDGEVVSEYEGDIE